LIAAAYLPAEKGIKIALPLNGGKAADVLNFIVYQAIFLPAYTL
jgi:hypothetical protein